MVNVFYIVVVVILMVVVIIGLLKHVKGECVLYCDGGHTQGGGDHTQGQICIIGLL